MRILWLTSCAADMWKASGRALVKSFLDTKSEGHLLVCPEGVPRADPAFRALADSGRGTVYGLDEFAPLHEWLAANKDVIPRHLGGAADGVCRCPGGPLDVHSKAHVMPCLGQWFNRNAARWFRKVAALAYALEYVVEPRRAGGGPHARRERHYDCVVWLDSDCAFRTAVTEKVVKGWFRHTNACFYLKNKRAVLESGVLGYHLGNGAKPLLEKIFELYFSGRFRTLARWDDCYITQKAIAATAGRVKADDIAYGVGAHAAVVPHSPVGPYIQHFKGKHGRGLGLMT